MQAAEKFSVAWFKLAEYVNRKEKERAFAIYRLLVHSLSGPALAAQLEGDLLYAFNDDKAVDAYTRAILLYERERQYQEAVFVYERARMLLPTFDMGSRMTRLYELSAAGAVREVQGEENSASCSGTVCFGIGCMDIVCVRTVCAEKVYPHILYQGRTLGRDQLVYTPTSMKEDVV